MSDTTANKWDRRYQDAQQPNPAAQVLNHHLAVLPAQGRALDLASGLGGNALLLADKGLETEAWDISPVAMHKLQHWAEQRRVPLHCRTLEVRPENLARGYFDVICISYFLDRSLCQAISASLAPGGVLFYQTYTRDKVAHENGASTGPSNPDFLLADGELLQLFADLQPLAYCELRDAGDVTQGLRNQAYLVARKPST